MTAMPPGGLFDAESLRVIEEMHAKVMGTDFSALQRELCHGGTVDRPDNVVSLDGYRAARR
jgi:hypothetical protein